jgi:hypothetical protein
MNYRLRLFSCVSVLLLAAGCGGAERDGLIHKNGADTLATMLTVPEGFGIQGAEIVGESFHGETVFGQTDWSGWVEMEMPANDYHFTATKGRYTTEWDITHQEWARWEFGPYAVDPTGADRLVVRGHYDDAGDTLNSIGFPYHQVDNESDVPADNSINVLTHPAVLAEYDVIFFSSGLDEAWFPHRDEVAENLREFVANGGSVYVSDLAYQIVEFIDEDAVDFAGDDNEWTGAMQGLPGHATLSIDDATLEECVLQQAAAEIELGSGNSWAVIESVRDDVNVVTRADVGDLYGGDSSNVPLAVSFQPFEGGGTVTFTSFQNRPDQTFAGWVILSELALRL